MNFEELDKLPKSSLLALLKDALVKNGSSPSLTSFKRPASNQVAELIEADKLKLSRELHDDLCPQLTCLEMGLHAIQVDASMTEEERTEKMGKLLTVVQNALLKTRTMIAWSDATDIEDVGLPQAISSWVNLMNSVLPMELKSVASHDDIALHPATAGVHIYRIAQESIQNAIKHSAASLVEVRLEVQGEDLLLIVQDNGKGKVEDGQLGETGCGVSNMRFRSQLLHAQLSFSENTPQGVKVICRIPSVILHANQRNQALL
jgi:two-component system sensor histidine kinase DegS